MKRETENRKVRDAIVRRRLCASSAEAQRETDPYVELAALMASLRQGTLHLATLLVDVAVDGLRRRANRARGGGAEHLAVPVLVLDEPKLDAAAAAGKQRHVHAALCWHSARLHLSPTPS